MSEKGKASPETGYSFSVRYPCWGDPAGALNRIADALERQAEATILLARATAGEFDQGEDVEPATDLTGRPLR